MKYFKGGQPWPNTPSLDHFHGVILGPVHTQRIEVQLKLVSKALLTIFEIQSASNMVGLQTPTDSDRLHGTIIPSDQEDQCGSVNQAIQAL